MEEWFMEHFGWLLLGFVILFTAIMVIAITRDSIKESEYEAVLVRMGYEVGDIDAFVKVTDFSRHNLIMSQAARKQFERFLRGEEMKIKRRLARQTPSSFRW